MKRLEFQNVPGIEKDEQIKKMFETYRKEMNGIVVFLIVQLVLLIAIL